MVMNFQLFKFAELQNEITLPRTDFLVDVLRSIIAPLYLMNDKTHPELNSIAKALASYYEDSQPGALVFRSTRSRDPYELFNPKLLNLKLSDVRGIASKVSNSSIELTDKNVISLIDLVMHETIYICWLEFCAMHPGLSFFAGAEGLSPAELIKTAAEQEEGGEESEKSEQPAGKVRNTGRRIKRTESVVKTNLGPSLDQVRRAKAALAYRAAFNGYTHKGWMDIMPSHQMQAPEGKGPKTKTISIATRESLKNKSFNMMVFWADSSDHTSNVLTNIEEMLGRGSRPIVDGMPLTRNPVASNAIYTNPDYYYTKGQSKVSPAAIYSAFGLGHSASVATQAANMGLAKHKLLFGEEVDKESIISGYAESAIGAHKRIRSAFGKNPELLKEKLSSVLVDGFNFHVELMKSNGVNSFEYLNIFKALSNSSFKAFADRFLARIVAALRTDYASLQQASQDSFNIVEKNISESKTEFEALASELRHMMISDDDMSKINSGMGYSHFLHFFAEIQLSLPSYMNSKFSQESVNSFFAPVPVLNTEASIKLGDKEIRASNVVESFLGAGKEKQDPEELKFEGTLAQVLKTLSSKNLKMSRETVDQLRSALESVSKTNRLMMPGIDFQNAIKDIQILQNAIKQGMDLTPEQIGVMLQGLQVRNIYSKGSAPQDVLEASAKAATAAADHWYKDTLFNIFSHSTAVSKNLYIQAKQLSMLLASKIKNQEQTSAAQKRWREARSGSREQGLAYKMRELLEAEGKDIDAQISTARNAVSVRLEQLLRGIKEDDESSALAGTGLKKVSERVVGEIRLALAEGKTYKKLDREAMLGIVNAYDMSESGRLDIEASLLEGMFAAHATSGVLLSADGKTLTSADLSKACRALLQNKQSEADYDTISAFLASSFSDDFNPDLPTQTYSDYFGSQQKYRGELSEKKRSGGVSVLKPGSSELDEEADPLLHLGVGGVPLTFDTVNEKLLGDVSGHALNNQLLTNAVSSQFSANKERIEKEIEENFEVDSDSGLTKGTRDDLNEKIRQLEMSSIMGQHGLGLDPQADEIAKWGTGPDARAMEIKFRIAALGRFLGKQTRSSVIAVLEKTVNPDTKSKNKDGSEGDSYFDESYYDALLTLVSRNMRLALETEIQDAVVARYKRGKFRETASIEKAEGGAARVDESEGDPSEKKKKKKKEPEPQTEDAGESVVRGEDIKKYVSRWIQYPNYGVRGGLTSYSMAGVIADALEKRDSGDVGSFSKAISSGSKLVYDTVKLNSLPQFVRVLKNMAKLATGHELFYVPAAKNLSQILSISKKSGGLSSHREIAADIGVYCDPLTAAKNLARGAKIGDTFKEAFDRLLIKVGDEKTDSYEEWRNAVVEVSNYSVGSRRRAVSDLHQLSTEDKDFLVSLLDRKYEPSLSWGGDIYSDSEKARLRVIGKVLMEPRQIPWIKEFVQVVNDPRLLDAMKKRFPKKAEGLKEELADLEKSVEMRKAFAYEADATAKTLSGTEIDLVECFLSAYTKLNYAGKIPNAGLIRRAIEIAKKHEREAALIDSLFSAARGGAQGISNANDVAGILARALSGVEGVTVESLAEKLEKASAETKEKPETISLSQLYKNRVSMVTSVVRPNDLVTAISRDAACQSAVDSVLRDILESLPGDEGKRIKSALAYIAGNKSRDIEQAKLDPGFVTNLRTGFFSRLAKDPYFVTSFKTQLEDVFGDDFDDVGESKAVSAILEATGEVTQDNRAAITGALLAAIGETWRIVIGVAAKDDLSLEAVRSHESTALAAVEGFARVQGDHLSKYSDGVLVRDAIRSACGANANLNKFIGMVAMKYTGEALLGGDKIEATRTMISDMLSLFTPNSEQVKRFMETGDTKPTSSKTIRRNAPAAPPQPIVRPPGFYENLCEDARSVITQVLDYFNASESVRDRVFEAKQAASRATANSQDNQIRQLFEEISVATMPVAGALSQYKTAYQLHAKHILEKANELTGLMKQAYPDIHDVLDEMSAKGMDLARITDEDLKNLIAGDMAKNAPEVKAFVSAVSTEGVDAVVAATRRQVYSRVVPKGKKIVGPAERDRANITLDKISAEIKKYLDVTGLNLLGDEVLNSRILKAVGMDVLNVFRGGKVVFAEASKVLASLGDSAPITQEELDQRLRSMVQDAMADKAAVITRYISGSTQSFEDVEEAMEYEKTGASDQDELEARLKLVRRHGPGILEKKKIIAERVVFASDLSKQAEAQPSRISPEFQSEFQKAQEKINAGRNIAQEIIESAQGATDSIDEEITISEAEETQKEDVRRKISAYLAARAASAQGAAKKMIELLQTEVDSALGDEEVFATVSLPALNTILNSLKGVDNIRPNELERSARSRIELVLSKVNEAFEGRFRIVLDYGKKSSDFDLKLDEKLLAIVRKVDALAKDVDPESAAGIGLYNIRLAASSILAEKRTVRDDANISSIISSLGELDGLIAIDRADRANPRAVSSIMSRVSNLGVSSADRTVIYKEVPDGVGSQQAVADFDKELAKIDDFVKASQGFSLDPELRAVVTRLGEMASLLSPGRRKIDAGANMEGALSAIRELNKALIKGTKLERAQLDMFLDSMHRFGIKTDELSAEVIEITEELEPTAVEPGHEAAAPAAETQAEAPAQEDILEVSEEDVTLLEPPAAEVGKIAPDEEEPIEVSEEDVQPIEEPAAKEPVPPVAPVYSLTEAHDALHQVAEAASSAAKAAGAVGETANKLSTLAGRLGAMLPPNADAAALPAQLHAATETAKAVQALVSSSVRSPTWTAGSELPHMPELDKLISEVDQIMSPTRRASRPLRFVRIGDSWMI